MNKKLVSILITALAILLSILFHVLAPVERPPVPLMPIGVRVKVV